jgi:uncharacterized membrane protein YgcG
MRFGVRSKAVAELEDVKTNLISVRRIIFTPDVDLKEELAKTAVQITCFDRTGKEVKRVTSTDDGSVEDNESLTPDPSPTGEGSGNSGGSNTGGDNTGGGNNGGGGNGDEDGDVI